MFKLLLICASVFFLVACGDTKIKEKRVKEPPNPLGMDDQLYACAKTASLGRDAKGNRIYADANKDGVLTVEEAKSIKSLNCNGRGIQHLQGLWNLPNLKKFSASANDLEKIDRIPLSDKDTIGISVFHMLPKLKELRIENNFFTDADCLARAELMSRGLEILEMDKQRDGRILTCDLAMKVGNVPIQKRKIDEGISPNRLSDIWGFVHKNQEYIAYGDVTHIHVYSISNDAPYIRKAFSHPRGTEEAVIWTHPNHSVWSEIRYFAKDDKAYIYVSSEGNALAYDKKNPQYATLQIIDVSDIKNPKEVELKEPHEGLRSIHNIALDMDRGILLAFGGTDHFCEEEEKEDRGKEKRCPAWKGNRLYSLENPAEPKYMRTVGDLYVHDSQIKNNFDEAGNLISSKLYSAHGSTAIHWDSNKTKNKDNRFRVYDLIDLTVDEIPMILDQHYAHGYCHNIWATEDENYVIVTGETSIDDQLSLWKLTPGENGKMVATEQDGLNEQGGSLAHNAFVRGNFIYTSHYSKGVHVDKIVDKEDQSGNMSNIPDKRLQRRWAYDTYPEHNTGEMNGSWGVYPFSQTTDLFFATDRDHGLFVFKKTEKMIREENEGFNR